MGKILYLKQRCCILYFLYTLEYLKNGAIFQSIFKLESDFQNTFYKIFL